MVDGAGRRHRVLQKTAILAEFDSVLKTQSGMRWVKVNHLLGLGAHVSVEVQY